MEDCSVSDEISEICWFCKKGRHEECMKEMPVNGFIFTKGSLCCLFSFSPLKVKLFHSFTRVVASLKSFFRFFRRESSKKKFVMTNSRIVVDLDKVMQGRSWNETSGPIKSCLPGLAGSREVTTDKVKKQLGPLKTDCLFPDNYNPTRDNGDNCPVLTCDFALISALLDVWRSSCESHLTILTLKTPCSHWSTIVVE